MRFTLARLPATLIRPPQTRPGAGFHRPAAMTKDVQADFVEYGGPSWQAFQLLGRLKVALYVILRLVRAEKRWEENFWGKSGGLQPGQVRLDFQTDTPLLFQLLLGPRCPACGGKDGMDYMWDVGKATARWPETPQKLGCRLLMPPNLRRPLCTTWRRSVWRWQASPVRPVKLAWDRP